MSGDKKIVGLFIGCVTLAVVILFGWGIVVTMNGHNFDVQCIKSGKTVQWYSLNGQGTAYKGCK